MRWRRLGFKEWVTLVLLGASGVTAAATWHISDAAAPFVKARAADLPQVRVGLVLGCSPTTADGRRNLYFERRLAAASALFRAGRVDYLLLSGDHSTPGYDEPNAMRRALIQAGVPPSRLVLDHAGLRTLDSVIRAQRVFGLDEVTIVSQRFQNERAVYLARAHGLRAFAFDAQDVGGATGLRMAAREAASRVVAILDAELLHTEPRFTGPREVTPF